MTIDSVDFVEEVAVVYVAVVDTDNDYSCMVQYHHYYHSSLSLSSGEMGW